jgi:hypothetical protein
MGALKNVDPRLSSTSEAISILFTGRGGSSVVEANQYFLIAEQLYFFTLV